MNFIQKAISRILPWGSVGRNSKQSSPYIGDGGNSWIMDATQFTQFMARRGSREILAAYKTSPWLKAVQKKISMEVGSLNWRVYVVRKGGNKAILPHYAVRHIQRAPFDIRKKYLSRLKAEGDIEEIPSHPLPQVLMGGNDIFPGNTNIILSQKYYDLIGEFFLLKDRNGMGMPVKLGAVPPHWVRAVPTKKNPFFEIRVGAKIHKFDPQDVIWVRDPDPENPYARGSGMGLALGDEIETDEQAAKFIKNTFYNHARPDFIVSPKDDPNTEPTVWSRQEMDRLRRLWLDDHMGAERVNAPRFMNRSVDVKTLGKDFAGMQMVQIRQYERDILIHVYGVPPEVLGIITNSNRATAEAADYLMSKYVISPRAEIWRSHLQSHLVPDYDERLIIDYDSPIDEDKEFRLKVMQAAPYMFTQDDFHEAAGMPPLPDGKGQVYMVPFTVAPHDQLKDSPPPPSQQTMGMKTKQLSIIEADRLVDILDDQQVRADVWHEVESEIKELIQHFGAEMLTQIGVDLVFEINSRVQNFIAQWGVERATLVDATTKKITREALVEGIGQGETIEQLASRIKDLYTGRLSDALRVAETETVRALGFSNTEAITQAGLDKKEWLATMDSNTRDSHAAMDGQVVTTNDVFQSPVSGASGPFPGELTGGAGENINCRCIVEAHFEGEERTIEQRTAAWKVYESQRRPWVKLIERGTKAAFIKQRDLILERLGGHA